MAIVDSISTDGIAAPRRTAFWNEAVCRVFTQLDSRPRYPDQFNAKLRRVALGDFTLSRVVSAPAELKHSEFRAHRLSEQVFLLHLQANGASVNRQDGREAILNTGDFTFCDSARAYALNFDTPNDMLVLRIPASQLRARLIQPEAFTARAVSGSHGVGALASQMLRGIWEQSICGLDDRIVERLVGNFLDLFATAICAEQPNLVATGSVGNAHRLRIGRYIEDQLTNPDLSPQQVAAAVGITPRYVHRLFEQGDETLGQYILRRRLEESARRLRDPTQVARSVTEIAFDYGFGDASFFSRCFKRQFGMTPKEYRRTQVATSNANAH
jgi:AraC-like DNA-binding protein